MVGGTSGEANGPPATTPVRKRRARAASPSITTWEA
jgi:hypothetical protein